MDAWMGGRKRKESKAGYELAKGKRQENEGRERRGAEQLAGLRRMK